MYHVMVFPELNEANGIMQRAVMPDGYHTDESDSCI